MLKIYHHTSQVTHFLEGIFYDLVVLAARIYLASIFFTSGWLKFQNFLNDNWVATVYLFTEVHPVPFLPPQIAAVCGTAGELTLSTLLAFGLFSRFAALGLLLMTAVIQLSLPDDVHFFWAMVFALMLGKGLGRITLDHVLGRTDA